MKIYQRYFGAAKDLPGVKELFEQEVVQTRKTRAELMKEIDAEYYGYLDDEDFLLLPQEDKCEKEARRLKIEEFKKKMESEVMEVSTEDNLVPEDVYNTNEISDDEGEEYSLYTEKKKNNKSQKKKHLVVPSLKEVEEAILEQKKRELLSRYASSELMESEAEAKQMSGKI